MQRLEAVVKAPANMVALEAKAQKVAAARALKVAVALKSMKLPCQAQ